MLENISHYTDIMNYMISYCSAMDICEMLCLSKHFNQSLKNIHISKIEVHGFMVFDLVQWLKKYNISSINSLKISYYNVINDHCMDGILEGTCFCVEDIITTLQSLKVKKLILYSVNLGNYVIIPQNLENLSLINIDTYSNMNWVNDILGLKELSLLLEYDPYHASYVSYDMYLSRLEGLKNPTLKSFATNYFYFKHDMTYFLSHCYKNENLELFSFQTVLDDKEYPPDINPLILEKFPNCVIKTS